jgi:anaerobic magnesium-protoporphyrin IX monomethyl ester cyclase
MTPRLALLSAPVSLEERYGRLKGAASTQASFGLVCLAAVALRVGASVTVIDAAAENLSIDEALARTLDFEPDVVGVSATTVGIVAAAQFAARVKSARPEALTVIGGCHVTALPEETLREFLSFDMAVLGEGEETLVEILSAIAAGRAPDGLLGTAARCDHSVIVNARRPQIDNLDTLPLPAWGLLKGFPAAYRPSQARLNRLPAASVVLTRGCPNQCVFCDRSVFGNHCRAYSPGYAVEMLRDLSRTYGVKEILIEDDTFVVSKKRVQEFCERLIAERIDLTWSCLGRADTVTPDLLKLMRRAGCWHISYGIESGDREILAAMHKNLDVEEIERALRWSREAGLKTKGFFIVGFPNESESSLAATRKLANRLPLDDISVMQLTPFPGSELYATAAQYGEFDRDWRRMNALNTVFVPRGMTKKSLDAASARMLKSFYMRPGILARKAAEAVSSPSRAGAMLKAGLALLKSIASSK